MRFAVNLQLSADGDYFARLGGKGDVFEDGFAKDAQREVAAFQECCGAVGSVGAGVLAAGCFGAFVYRVCKLATAYRELLGEKRRWLGAASEAVRYWAA